MHYTNKYGTCILSCDCNKTESSYFVSVLFWKAPVLVFMGGKIVKPPKHTFLCIPHSIRTFSAAFCVYVFQRLIPYVHQFYFIYFTAFSYPNLPLLLIPYSTASAIGLSLVSLSVFFFRMLLSFSQASVALDLRCNSIILPNTRTQFRCIKIAAKTREKVHLS